MVSEWGFLKALICMMLAFLMSGLALYAIAFGLLTSKRVLLALYRKIMDIIPEITNELIDKFSLSEEEKGGEEE